MEMNHRWISLLGLTAAAVIALVVVGGCAQSKEKEQGEVTVTLDQTPAAVQATLIKQVGDGKLEGIDKETKDGKTTYEADAIIGGKEYEINVAEDGTLLGKKLEHEKNGESGEKRESGEKPDND